MPRAKTGTFLPAVKKTGFSVLRKNQFSSGHKFLLKKIGQNKENLAAMKSILCIVFFFFWPLVASKPQLKFGSEIVDVRRGETTCDTFASTHT
jgi:hypothetical protein